MSKIWKIDILRLIQEEKLGEIVAKALANLKEDGGDPRLAYAIVHVRDAGEAMGAGANKQRGDHSIDGALESAIANWQKNGGNMDHYSPQVIVTFIDGSRVGTAMTTDGVSIEHYVP